VAVLDGLEDASVLVPDASVVVVVVQERLEDSSLEVVVHSVAVFLRAGAMLWYLLLDRGLAGTR